MEDINPNEPKDIIKDEPKDIKPVGADEPKDKPEDEPKDIKDNEPDDHSQKVKDGKIKTALERVTTKDNKINPELLAKEEPWVQELIDKDYKQEEPEVEEDDRETWYAKKRDKEVYDEKVKGLKSEYEEEDVQKIEDKVTDLVDNHNMPRMKAYDLITAGLEPSENSSRKEDISSQTFSHRKDVTEDIDLSGFDQVAKNYKAQTGLDMTKESYKKGIQAGFR